MLRFSSLALLGLCPALAWAQVPIITGVSPTANARAAARNSSVNITFSQALNASAASALKVYSARRSGLRSRGTNLPTVSGNMLSYTPARPFTAGETVRATVTRPAASAGGSLANARVFSFTTAVTGTGRGTFQAGSTAAVGATPYGVSLGDIDGDGDLDALAANALASNVSVLLNNGSGAYTAGTAIGVGLGPYSVTLGDVDGDGDLDVLTPNYSENTVSVRLNNGTGTFTAGQTIAIGNAPTQVVLGDVDGDGDLDMAVANSLGTTTNIVLNGGDATGSNTGVFANGSSVTVSTESGSIALADVDGDGDEDLLALSISVGVVMVKLNGGNATGSNTGTFSGSGFVTVGSNSPVSLVLGDVDGDNDLDLLAANYSGSTVNVRLNNGTGSFSGSQSVSVGASPHEVVLGDVDADGDLDLLTASADFGSAGTTVSVRLNGGDATGSNTGVFGGGSTVAVGNYPRHLVLGDIDADGDLDLLASNANDNTVSVRLNGGTGPLAARSAAPATALAVYPNPTAQASTLSGAAPGAAVQVVDAVGRRVATVAADAAGTAQLPATLAPGAYLVQTAGQLPVRLLVE